jgi:hypothetical protein
VIALLEVVSLVVVSLVVVSLVVVSLVVVSWDWSRGRSGLVSAAGS